MIVAERDGAILRYARKEDMPRIDEITVVCYRGIHESYVRMLDEQCYQAVRHYPHLTWEERKTGQVHRLFSEHPEWVWVLAESRDHWVCDFYVVSRPKPWAHRQQWS